MCHWLIAPPCAALSQRGVPRIRIALVQNSPSKPNGDWKILEDPFSDVFSFLLEMVFSCFFKCFKFFTSSDRGCHTPGRRLQLLPTKVIPHMGRGPKNF